MFEFLRIHQTTIYAVEFAGLLVLISLLECFLSRRAAKSTLKLRWFGNAVSLILGSIARDWIFPVAGFALAVVCEERGWGLLNRVSLPNWVEWSVTMLVLDFWSYHRHRLAHTFSPLWRLHRMHHTDDDVDMTTTWRFHPLDVLYITATNMALIVVLGLAPMGVVLFQLLSTIIDFASHANIHVPDKVDQWIRRFIITPYMHRLHHSQDFAESNSNFGNTFPFWDRWLGTYMARPKLAYEEMQFGLPEFAERKHQSLPWMMAQPFLRVPPQSR